MGSIRYSNCWEDASVLLQAMNPKKGGVYLSIASAGDNTLAILSQEPSLVLAADISPAQIARRRFLTKLTVCGLDTPSPSQIRQAQQILDALILGEQ